MTTSTDFVCPTCGGRRFGSHENDDGTRTYTCGEIRHGVQCRFSVHGDHLWKHMFRVTVTREPFTSHEDYVASYNKRAGGKAL